MGTFEDSDRISFAKYLFEVGRLDAPVLPEPKEVQTERGGVLAPPGCIAASYVYLYPDGQVRLVQMKHPKPSRLKSLSEKQNSYDRKLENNICRAQSTVMALAISNPWEWFLTLTIDGKKYRRDDLKNYHSDLAQFIRDLRKNTMPDLAYMLVPEKHADGVNWHEHGFLHGLHETELVEWDEKTAPTRDIREKIQQGRRQFDWPKYSSKFGYCVLEPLFSKEQAGAYMTKYMRKSMARDVTQLGAHLYYASQGLLRPELVAEGYVREWMPPGMADFDGHHCAVKLFRTKHCLMEALSYLRPEKGVCGHAHPKEGCEGMERQGPYITGPWTNCI